MCSTSAVGFLPCHFPVTSSARSPPPLGLPCLPGFGILKRRPLIGQRQAVTSAQGLFARVYCAVNSAYGHRSCVHRSTSIGRLQTELGAMEEGANSSEVTTDAVVYQGAYGPWTVESSDIKEVILYRTGLVVAAASFVIASSTAFLNESEIVNDLIHRNLDLFYVLGSCGLGLSLYLIHIYVKEIKQALQALWLIGALGSLVTYASLAHPSGKSLVDYVVENPGAVWFVGPLFAALTGLVFKEGLCYGKLEAGVLTFIIPSLLLGHLTGLMDGGTKLSVLGVWVALFVVFSGRKFTQPIKDDIGDKSVFIFNALPPEEKAALAEKLEQQNYYQK